MSATVYARVLERSTRCGASPLADVFCYIARPPFLGRSSLSRSHLLFYNPRPRVWTQPVPMSFPICATAGASKNAPRDIDVGCEYSELLAPTVPTVFASKINLTRDSCSRYARNSCLPLRLPLTIVLSVLQDFPGLSTPPTRQNRTPRTNVKKSSKLSHRALGGITAHRRDQSCFFLRGTAAADLTIYV